MVEPEPCAIFLPPPEGWTKWIEPAILLRTPEDRGYMEPVHDPEKAKYTPEEELDRMQKEIDKSDGFDIDFSYFRCIFNYFSAYLDSNEFVDKPKTTGDLLEELANEAVDDYNKTNKTDFEFVKVVKANFHLVGSCGIMFLITFEVRDPYDDVIKPFQARVRYLKDTITEHVFCRPKPSEEVKYFGNAKTHGQQVDKKPRLK